MSDPKKNDEKEEESKSKPEQKKDEASVPAESTAQPTNAATDYGMEGREANQQDPRVNALRAAEDNNAERRASLTSERSKKQSPRRDTRTNDPDDATNAATNFGLESHTANRQDPRVEEIQAAARRDRLKTQSKSPAAVTPKVETGGGRPTPQPIPTPPLAPPPTPQTTAPPVETAPQPEPVDTSEPPPRPSRPQDIRMPPPTMYTPRQSAQTRASVSSRDTASTVPVAPKPVAPAPEKVTKATETTQLEEPQLERCCSKLINTDVTFDPSKEFSSKTTNTAPDTTGLLTDEEQGLPPPPTAITQTTVLDVDDCFEVAVTEVKAAGALALQANQQQLEYTTKQHDHDLLTRTDNDVEDMLILAITSKFPNHKFICEEAVSQSETGQVELTDEPTWIIDPIDGTMNFVHHFPYYCISVAFLVNKQTEFGIIYNPPMKDCYTARRGKGAYLNGEPIRTSGQANLQHAMILQEYSSGMNDARNVVVLDNAKRLLKKTHAMRSIGSSAMGLAMVASGVADGFYYFGLHIWDMAAGNLLVTEAGGTVIDPAGGELDIMSRRCLAAATESLALELAAELSQNYPSPRDDQPKSVNPNEYGPDGQKVDFIGQTDFTDSSESLTTDSAGNEYGNEKSKKKEPVQDNKV